MLFFRQRDLAGAALVLLTLSATASDAVAKPKPGRGFRLFASAENIFTVNRVQCRIFSDGQICATGSSTVGGGLWPRGTANQYVFGSGVNLAGIIEPGDRSVNGFAGDTAGAFFNNTGADNGEVRPIFDSNDRRTRPGDEARVPCAVDDGAGLLGRAGATRGALFDPALQGAITASQGDLWFMSWEGSAGSDLELTRWASGRDPSPGLELPPGNGDVIYFLTLCSITSRKRITRRSALAAADPAGAGRGVPGDQRRPVRHQPAGRRVRHQRPVRRVRGGHGRGPGGR
jgi:hypothetical protein